MEKLHYLDYSLVDVNEAGQAREQYQDELEEFKEVKAIEDAALAREADHVKYLSMLKEANIIILETLITDMFKEDTEMSKIEILPGLRNLIDDYTEKGKTSTEEIKLILLEKHALLTKEMNLFQQKYHKLQQDAQQASIQATEIYRRTVKNLLKKASTSTTSTSNTNQEQAIQALHEAEVLAEKLYQDLMNHESDLVEIVQELILSMEVNIENISTQSREISTEHFRAIEVLENNFFESVSRLAVTLLERMASEDGEEDDFLTDECRAILNDRYVYVCHVEQAKFHTDLIYFYACM
jgi:hypothetical protein